MQVSWNIGTSANTKTAVNMSGSVWLAVTFHNCAHAEDKQMGTT